MNGAIVAALASHWRRNRLQLLTLVLGLAMATALWSGVQAINAEARASYDAAAATLSEGRFDQLLPREGDTIAQQRFVDLRRAGWLVSPVVEGRLRVGRSSLRLIGVEPLTMPEGSAASAALSRADLEEIVRADMLVAGPDAAALLKSTVSNPVMIDPAVAPGTVLADIGAAQSLLRMEGRISRMIVLSDQPLKQRLLGQVASDLALQQAQASNDVGRLTDSFHLNLTAFGFLSFAVGIFIVHGAIGLAFEQRRGMVRTLRALGVPLSRLIFLIALELVVLALTAGAIGVVLGYVIAALLLPDVAATIRGLYGADVAGNLQLRPVWWLSGLAMALGGAGLAATSAFWRLAQMPILASAGARSWAMASTRTRVLQSAAAILLIGAAALLASVGKGLAAGFALLACLLLGAALMLPASLAAILRLGETMARRPMAQWFWADTRQQLPGLSLALMALLLAMAANVGVSTMVSSFRLTFIGFLDQRLSAELYVDAGGVADRASLERFLGERADAVLPIMSVDATLAGLPAEIFGARVGSTYRDNWRFLSATDAVWDEVEAGSAVVINEQLSRRAGLAVGDRLVLGPTLTLPVAGVVGDYGNPIGQAIIGEALFRQSFPSVLPSRYGLRTGDPQALRQALGETFGISADRIIDQAALKAFSLSVFERTFSVTGALNVLTLTVAAFAILMSLLTLAALRLPQMAPVWALGTTQRRLAWLDMLRTVLLAAVTAFLALPLGLALAWVLLAIVNVEAFGWRLPMYLFPADYARLLLFALVAALAAALWPAWRLARMEPAALLRISPMNVRVIFFLLLGVGHAFAQGFAGLGTNAEGFAVPERGRQLVFPRDHGPHPDFRIEWWYVTANLKGPDGADYGLQWTLFRTALAPGEAEGWNSPQVWFGHAAVTSLTMHHATERFARGGTGQAGVTAQPFAAWIDDWRMQGDSFDVLRLSATGKDFAYDVKMQAKGPLVLHGDRGYSVKSAKGQSSHYYSQPFFSIEGTLTLPDGDVPVRGSAWVDREWSSQPLAEDQEGWDWFSLSFDSGEKLMGFRLRDEGGGGYTSATWIGADGAATPYDDGALVATPLETSVVDGRNVPTRWRLSLPERALDVTIGALNPQSWMGLRIPYWEGPVKVTGSHPGMGYLEMTGYERD